MHHLENTIGPPSLSSRPTAMLQAWLLWHQVGLAWWQEGIQYVLMPRWTLFVGQSQPNKLVWTKRQVSAWVGGVHQHINVKLMPNQTAKPYFLGMLPQDRAIVDSWFRHYAGLLGPYSFQAISSVLGTALYSWDHLYPMKVLFWGHQ